MNFRLSLTSTEMDAEDLQAFTRDFCDTANSQTGLQAEWVQKAGAPGTRGSEVFQLGNLVLTFLTSGAAVALINVCKSFFERSSSIEMSFEREDGKKLSIKAQNVKSDQIAKTMETVREFFGGNG